MPTGYTQRIISREITTFKEFAKLSMRGMGVSVHMRDEPLDKPFEPREVDSFYKDGIKEIEANLEKLRTISDDELVSEHRVKLERDIAHWEKTLKEKRENKKLLDSIYAQAQDYVPPTPEHQGVKNFMCQQLRDTINMDCDTKYCEERLEESRNKVNNIDPKELREKLIKEDEGRLQQYTDGYNREVEIAKSNNQWAEKYFESLEKYD